MSEETRETKRCGMHSLKLRTKLLLHCNGTMVWEAENSLTSRTAAAGGFIDFKLGKYI